MITIQFTKTHKSKRYLPRTAEEKEHIKIQEFLDMCAPTAIKFYPDHYICGSTYRSVWAVREYPTETNEQAILRHLGEKSGVTLRIYSRHVTPAEERKIINNAASKGQMERSSSNLQQTVIAEANLQNVTNIVLQKLYKNKNISDKTDFSSLKPSDYPILSDLYELLQEEYNSYAKGTNSLYTKEMLRKLCLGLDSI